MKTFRGIGQRLAAACVVAVGVAVVWGLIASWVGALSRLILPAPERASESLLVAIDGTPVIATQSTEFSSITVARRTIEGKPWPLDYEDWLGGAYFHRPYQPPGLVEMPLSWDAGYYGGIVGASDGKLPPTAWYFICDDKSTSHLYAAGYDAFSKLPIGYIGREGFRATTPPLSEQFVLPNVTENELPRLIISSQDLEYKSIVRFHNLWAGADPPPWFVYMLEAEQLWEIDLRQRTAHSVAQFNGAMSIVRAYVTKPTFDQLASAPPVETAESAAEPQAESATTESNTGNAADAVDRAQKYAALMVVREPDRLIYFELPTGKRRDYLLPEKLLDRRFSAFLLSADQLLIFAHEQFFEYWSGGPITRLFWIDRQGKIEREAEVKLAGWVPESPRRKAWKLAAVAPVPIAWLVGTAMVDPLLQIQSNNAANYATALRNTFAAAWPPLLIVLVVGVLVAWLAVRWHRRNFRPRLGWWAAFVFLFGPAGLIAYWLEHCRPKLEPCSKCGQIVPRDRDACAACDAQFPTPPRVGTEIFA